MPAVRNGCLSAGTEFSASVSEPLNPTAGSEGDRIDADETGSDEGAKLRPSLDFERLWGSGARLEIAHPVKQSVSSDCPSEGEHGELLARRDRPRIRRRFRRARVPCFEPGPGRRPASAAARSKVHGFDARSFGVPPTVSSGSSSRPRQGVNSTRFSSGLRIVASSSIVPVSPLSTSESSVIRKPGGEADPLTSTVMR